MFTPDQELEEARRDCIDRIVRTARKMEEEALDGDVRCLRLSARFMGILVELLQITEEGMNGKSV